ncbi:hypothetical protein ACFT1A_26565 [Rhodococcus sp. NPDC057135]|uniref:hypothetical protein n=1 Tax=Rhodococcus sp. NPDC057135 TaxID=3346028 RepID=UPI0036366FA7
MTAGPHVQAFDLNIDTVLKHWSLAFAIREIIANALDEHKITGTTEPVIEKVEDGTWEIRDFGRGLRYQHLTQNESTEKQHHQDVIGQFGVGLKDALAVFERNDVGVTLHSAHGDISTGRQAKPDFGDIVTLHALVTAPADPQMVGTLVRITGIADTDVEAAKELFLKFSGDLPLEQTRFGEVLERRPDSDGGRVYVRGLLVAVEPRFLFSYNIIDLNAPLRRALNRERSNVGRTAYSSRVKDMLIACTSREVAEPLTVDLAGYASGTIHAELDWKDVKLHACRVLQTNDKVLFITARQLEQRTPQLEYAKDDGYRLVVVPDDLAKALGNETDLEGRPLVDLDTYRKSWNESFSYTFVEPGMLTPAEQQIFSLAAPTAQLAQILPGQTGVTSILISETMRLNDGGETVLGLYQKDMNRIVIHRGQLANADRFCGTLLHELAHARSGATDGTREFERELTKLLGAIAAAALNGVPGPVPASQRRSLRQRVLHRVRSA